MDEPISIREVPLFKNLPAAQLKALEAAALRQLYSTGEVIFNQGDPPAFLYLVESGGIDIVLPSEGEEIILASFAPGSFFGEMAIFDGQPRNATARAVDDTALVCVPGQAVIKLFESYPPAARQFLSVVAMRLRSANEMLTRLQIKNVNTEIDERLTVGDRVADMVARFGGSWTFIFTFCSCMAAWMTLNSVWLFNIFFSREPFDPFPFILLNLALSTVAALQGPVIMMSQNRASTKDRLQADLDYQVNLKSEHAIQQLHRKIDELRATLLQHRAADDSKKRKKDVTV